MLTASISGRLGSAGSRWAVIQSRPQTYHDTRPAPLEFRIRTAHRRTPGATPTTPMPLSRAPTMPATCVPCPLPSSHAARFEVEQFTPPTTLRSGWSLSIPVSTMATSASTRWSMPSMREIGFCGANTRRTPRGVVCASSEITPSGDERLDVRVGAQRGDLAGGSASPSTHGGRCGTCGRPTTPIRRARVPAASTLASLRRRTIQRPVGSIASRAFVASPVAARSGRRRYHGSVPGSGRSRYAARRTSR